MHAVELAIWDITLQGVEFWAVNTDAQALENSLSKNKLQLGGELTRGLGAFYGVLASLGIPERSHDWRWFSACCSPFKTMEVTVDAAYLNCGFLGAAHRVLLTA